MKGNRIALLPGSFDPITLGHFDIAVRTAKLFDCVYVVGFCNSEKSGIFSGEERLALLRATFAGYDNIKTDISEGMVADYAEKIGADAVVKGVRSVADFEYEFTLSEISRRLSPDVETVFMPSRAEYAYISSSYVREMIKYGRPLDDAIPPAALELFKELRTKKSRK